MIALLLAISLALTGCSTAKKTDELRAYQNQMEQFFTSVQDYNQQLASLDSTSEGQFLNLIDGLADACETAAGTTVPEDYKPASSLCRSANSYMQEAKENYHAAFESAAFNEADFNTAQGDYRKAMAAVQDLAQYFENYGF